MNKSSRLIYTLGLALSFASGLAPVVFASDGESLLTEPAISNALSPKEIEAKSVADALFETLNNAKPILTQDDVYPLIDAAGKYAKIGEHEKAIAILEKAIQVPAAPHAQPPGPDGGPRDYRGWISWMIADSHRGQHRWGEALKEYQFNRANSPLDDGCVGTGEGFQRMALKEGLCLEYLGRTDKAVELYWRASLRLTSGPPLAMRRLEDLYNASGQMRVLETSIDRESQAFQANIRKSYTISEDGRKQKVHMPDLQKSLNESPMATFGWLRTYREDARKRRWHRLLAALKYDETQRYQYPAYFSTDTPITQRREAIAALGTMPNQAIPVIEKALNRDAENPFLQASLLFCLSLEHRPAALAVQTYSVTEGVLKEAIGYEDVPFQFPQPSKKARLTENLPPIY